MMHTVQLSFKNVYNFKFKHLLILNIQLLIYFSLGSFLYFGTKPLQAEVGTRPWTQPSGEPGTLPGAAGLHRAQEREQGVRRADE